jgi:hypothetical protein
VNSTEWPPDPIPDDRPTGSSGIRKISLRQFVVAIVAVCLGMFVWDQTDGNVMVSTLVAALAAVVVDIRVSDARSH